MEYLLKSILCLLLLLLFYRLILQREVLYQFNRFFLLAAIVASFLIPLLTIEVKQEVPVEPFVISEYKTENPYLESIIQEDEGIQLNSTIPDQTKKVEIPWITILWGVYFLGMIIFLLRFIRNIYRIQNQIRTNPKIVYRQENLVLLKQSISPFSFLKYIFYPKEPFEKEGMPEAIFLHEQCHVHQKHSWDTLFVEALLVLLWFHPGLYLARMAIRLNHEFIADQQVVKKMPVSDYQNLLLTILSGRQSFALGSNLNFSLTKKRFDMMKKSSNPGIKILKLTSLVVFLGAMIWLFAEKTVVSSLAQESVEDRNNSLNQSVTTVSLQLNEEGEIYWEGNKISKEQLTQELVKYDAERLIVELKSAPKVKMGEVADIQNLLATNNIRKIEFQGGSSSNQPEPLEIEKERYFRDAIFLIESEQMDYTQKRYFELSENEKDRLQFSSKPQQRKSPDSEAFESFKNKDEFAVWIDGQVISNQELENYKPEDFVLVFQSRVFSNARSERFPQPYQVHLYRENYFQEKYGPDSEMFRPRSNQDTITLTQRRVTWMKDISRYPDPTTAFLQKNARYEKLKLSDKKDEPEVKKEIERLYLELEKEYNQAKENRKKQLPKPLPTDTISPVFKNKSESNSRQISFSSSSNSTKINVVPAVQSNEVRSYLRLYSEFQAIANENRIFANWTYSKIQQMETKFKELEARYMGLSIIERRGINRANFPFIRLQKDGMTIYKRPEDLSAEERKNLAC